MDDSTAIRSSNDLVPCLMPWVAPGHYGPATRSGKPWPRISIITPNFNQGEFLEATLCSVLGQNYPNLEYIVVDGGSTDGSLDVIARYQHRLADWISEPDRGQYDAVNKGFALATGEIMAWLNSDDLYLPWTLRTVAEIMTDLPEVSWLTALHHGYCDVDGRFVGIHHASGFARDCFLDGGHLGGKAGSRSVIQQESTFWRSSLWREVGDLDAQFKLGGDFDLWGRMFEHAELYGVGIPLAAFRFRAGQRASALADAYRKDAEESLERRRMTANWSASPLRYIGNQLRMHRFGAVSNRLARIWGYRAKRVERTAWGERGGVWRVRDYYFP